MTKRRVIPGTCPRCGYVPGCVNEPLTADMSEILVGRGYTVSRNVHGDSIAAPPNNSMYSDARMWFHRAVCGRRTWHARLLAEEVSPEA